MLEGYGPGFPPLEELMSLEPDEVQQLLLSEPTPELGRYFNSVAFLGDVTSQRAVALVRFRVIAEYLIALGDLFDRYQGPERKIVHHLSDTDIAAIRRLARDESDIVRAEWIERYTEHDTAAAGDYFKILLGTKLPHLEPMIEGVCFAETSEDTMGPVFGMIANKVVYGHFVPKMISFILRMLDYVEAVEVDGPLCLPGLTHEQAAEPTTFGKKVVTNLVAVDTHLRRMIADGRFIPFPGKFGGAVGNLTNHFAAYPGIYWRGFARSFIEGLGLTYEEMTFQSGTYALEASLLTECAHMMTHVIKLVDDFIDDFIKLASCPGQLFVKRKKPGTKGSSVMPNKSNAWGMEGALAMLKRSRAELFRYAEELPLYPHEGNMGRSYLFRALGGVFMPAFIALDRILREMVGDMEKSGYWPNPEKIAAFFAEYPGMAGSSIQTTLKREGIEGDAYREIEGISINPDGTYADSEQFADGLERVMESQSLSEDVRAELRLKLNPAHNVGDADNLSSEHQKILRHNCAVHSEWLQVYQQPLFWAPPTPRDELNGRPVGRPQLFLKCYLDIFYRIY